MNLLFKYSKDKIINDYSNKVLEFRKKSVSVWTNILLDVAPKILERSKFLKDVSVSLKDSSLKYTYHGFAKKNVKILKITAKIGEDEVSKNIYVPYPDDYDIFEVNGSRYILINQLVDKPCAIYRDSKVDKANIRIKSFLTSYLGITTVGKQKINTLMFLIAIGVIPKESIEIYLKKSEIVNNDELFKNKHSTVGIKLKENFPINPNSLFFKNIIEPAIIRLTPKLLKKIDNEIEKITKQIEFYDLGSYYRILFGFDLDKPNTECLRDIFLTYVLPNYDSMNNKKFYNLHTKRVMYFDIIVKKLLDEFDKYVLMEQNKRQPPKKIHISNESVLKWLISSNPLFEYIDLSKYNLLEEINMKESIYFIMEYYKDQYRNLDLSFKYMIDPINTPDSDKIGQKQRLSKDVELDEFGNFVL